MLIKVQNNYAFKDILVIFSFHRHSRTILQIKKIFENLYVSYIWVF